MKRLNEKQIKWLSGGNSSLPILGNNQTPSIVINSGTTSGDPSGNPIPPGG